MYFILVCIILQAENGNARNKQNTSKSWALMGHSYEMFLFFIVSVTQEKSIKHRKNIIIGALHQTQYKQAILPIVVRKENIKIV